MALPPGWPPRPAASGRSIRFFVEGTATAAFADSAYLFASGAGANTFTPTPVVEAGDDSTKYPAPAATVLPTGAFGGGTNDGTIIVPQIWSFQILIRLMTGTRLEWSFDGTNVHGALLTGDDSNVVIMERREAGIAVRGAGATFIVEAW
jgi:hypothetical protein